ncbi:MAG: PH domain-containing protein [Alphaproteobacteria bacterium]|nr:PH domain-containing protein [Alphaproteobacteria bacterium]
MSYVRSVLQPGEQIKAVGRLHWIIYHRAILLSLVGIVLLFSAGHLNEKLQQPCRWVALAVFALAALAFLHARFQQWMSELAITNHRVIYKRGFLWRHTVEMNMDKVETVDVGQSILDRLLGYGTIRVRGTGQGIETLSRIAHPIELRNAITAR